MEVMISLLCEKKNVILQSCLFHSLVHTLCGVTVMVKATHEIILILKKTTLKGYLPCSDIVYIYY